MVHISQAPQSSSGWLGDGKIVYRTGNKPNTPFADNPALQRLQASYKQAQAQRRASQVADKAARQAGKSGHVTVYDASKKAYVSATPQEASVIRNVNKEIQVQRRTAQAAKTAKTGNVTVYDAAKKAYVSATPQEAKLIEAANHKINTRLQLSQRTQLSPSVIDNNLGLNKAVKSAKESAAAFIEHGLTDTEKVIEQGSKKKGFWSSLGSGIKNLFTKAKNFFKTPKGKWALVGAAVVAVGTALWAYVSDRFSDKNKPTPTNGPSKVFMPKLNETDEDQKVEETEETDEAESKEGKTDTEKSDNDTTVVAPVPVEESDDESKTDEAKESDENKDQKTMTSDEIYKVVKGDNLWNIAKQDLINKNKDKSDYVPIDIEISNRTEELMKLNNKEYEQPLPEDSRKRVVLIEPDEEIKLK